MPTKPPIKRVAITEGWRGPHTRQPVLNATHKKIGLKVE